MPTIKRILFGLALFIISGLVVGLMYLGKLSYSRFIFVSFSSILTLTGLYLLFCAYIYYQYFHLPIGKISVNGQEIPFRYLQRNKNISGSLITEYLAVSETKLVGTSGWYLEFKGSVGPWSHGDDLHIVSHYFYIPQPNESAIQGTLTLGDQQYPITLYQSSQSCDCPVASMCLIHMYDCMQPVRVGTDQIMLVTATLGTLEEGESHTKKMKPF